MADRGRPRARSAPFLAKKPALASKFFFRLRNGPDSERGRIPGCRPTFGDAQTRRAGGAIRRSVIGPRIPGVSRSDAGDAAPGRDPERASRDRTRGRGSGRGGGSGRRPDRGSAGGPEHARRRPGIAVRCARRIAPGRGVSACGGLSGHATVRLIGGAGAGRWCTRSWAASGHATLRLTGGAGRFIMDPLLLAPDVSP